MDSHDATIHSTAEVLYPEALQAFRTPEPEGNSRRLFVVLIVLFLLSMAVELRSVTEVVGLTIVVLIHELGHALGMRFFGFRDVRMFFVPFFGAAVTGRARGVAAWKEAIVSLLGPLPGLVVATVLIRRIAPQPEPSPLVFKFAETMFGLNVFSLLPLGFLDGGQFFSCVLFRRHRLLEVLSIGGGTLLLVLLAVSSQAWVLAVFALFPLFQMPSRWRAHAAVRSLRERFGGLDADPERLSETEARALFEAAVTVHGRFGAPAARSLAERMEFILAAAKPAPRWRTTLGLLSLYGVAVIVALVAAVGLDRAGLSPHWHWMNEPGWRAEFPRAPFLLPTSGSASEKSWRAVIAGTERFGVMELPAARGANWTVAMADRLSAENALPRSRAFPVTVGGRPAIEWRFATPRRELRARMLESRARRFVVTASAPTWGENQQRFLDSFRVTESESPAPSETP